MQPIDFILISLAILGHFSLWVMVTNRLHALRCRCGTLALFDMLIRAAVVGVPGVWTIWVGWFGGTANVRQLAADGHFLALAYIAVCIAAILFVLQGWVRTRGHRIANDRLLANHTTVVDIAKELGRRPVTGFTGMVVGHIPGNEIFRLHVNEKTLSLPRLDKRLDGLRIAHLSDLHFTGHIDRDFFDHVIEYANSLEADLVAITGDLVDFEHCFDWIPQTLGKLRSRHGTYAILGNHDWRLPDPSLLRSRLAESGIVDLGRQVEQITIRDCPITLAGNELPWFPLADGLEKQLSTEPADSLRVLLSHSPDQIRWAQRRRFDLMLAGHTHGGQIRVPFVGPLVCPSIYGVRYSAGMFYEQPTAMHVSRGISGLHPIRYNCSPEITALVLRAT